MNQKIQLLILLYAFINIETDRSQVCWCSSSFQHSSSREFSSWKGKEDDQRSLMIYLQGALLHQLTPDMWQQLMWTCCLLHVHTHTLISTPAWRAPRVRLVGNNTLSWGSSPWSEQLGRRSRVCIYAQFSYWSRPNRVWWASHDINIPDVMQQLLLTVNGWLTHVRLARGYLRLLKCLLANGSSLASFTLWIRVS